jgi:hypothetical protein
MSMSNERDWEIGWAMRLTDGKVALAMSSPDQPNRAVAVPTSATTARISSVHPIVQGRDPFDTTVRVADPLPSPSHYETHRSRT